MAVNFQIGQTLPATQFLKISWTETSAQAFVQLGLQIKTDNNRFDLVKSLARQVQSDVDPLDIDTDYSVAINASGIATWTRSQNRSPEWLLSCGEESDISCGIDKYIIIDTSLWSSDKRTITTLSQAAINELTWEDVSLINNLFAVYFNSAGGTIVDNYNNIFSGTLIDEPTAPTRPLFIFEGWFKEPTYQTEWDFTADQVTETITLYAKWDLDELNIDLATTNSIGVVQLSDATELIDLSNNDNVITEQVQKNILEDIILDIEEALDEV
jgi:uncharacterized repeat protein (TIGR02543 family)